MKIVETCDILHKELFTTSKLLRQAWNDVRAAIAATDWPHGSGRFTIYPESGKKRGKGNGVVPIKLPCVRKLLDRGWKNESLPDIKGGVLNVGDLDALLVTKKGSVAFEWETGNISSSHRAINKLLLTLQVGGLLGGFLVVPSDKLKLYLTDRIGNIGELRGYFPLWQSIRGAAGALRIIVVEHDDISKKVPRIPKGTDGRALA
ncbi:MAG: hypothetical protein WCI73_05980 [Phycisphaerae bacterium]